MLKLLWVLAQLICVLFGSEHGPEIRLEDGTVRGKFMLTKGGRKFSAFTGIPFAKPPIGDLRFKPPVPNDPWEGILNATKIHSICPQRDVYRRTELIEGNEDCLYLNVYTHKLPQHNADPLPVMVFLHGGGWLCGAGNSLWYSPELLLDRDIVLVVPNYRLGALGFLSTGDEVVSGNNGLKDQNMALKWIKKNIDKFGGDPNSVTVFGESAGGASAHFHMVSPMSKGLVNKVISQSGTAFCTWSIAAKDEGIRNSKKLAKLLGCPTEPSVEMVECLRNVDAYTIIQQDNEFMEWDYDPMIPFKPVIEPNVPNAFISEHPADTIKAGRSAQIPLIVGINTEDGALKVAAWANLPHLIKEFNDGFEKLAPLSLFYNYLKSEDKDSITKKLKEYYFNGEDIHTSNISNLVNLYTDGWFLNCADDAVRYQLMHSNQPVYYYLFGYRGGSSFTEIFGGGDKNLGVCHCDDLQYIFPVGDGLFPDKEPTEEEKQLRELLTTLWANFAKFGNPTPELNSVVKEKWEPVKSENMEYYYINSPESPEMKSGLFLERAKLWRSLSFDRNLDKIKEEL